jgi:hypothetical protein
MAVRMKEEIEPPSGKLSFRARKYAMIPIPQMTIPLTLNPPVNSRPAPV